MRNQIDSKALFLFTSLAAYAIYALVAPGIARAQWYNWEQDSSIPGFSGSPGCATEIAVGSNNIPWVLGCGGPGDRSIYYLQPRGARSWVYANGAAISITVSTDGEPWVVTSNGHIWHLDPQGSGQWDDLIAQQAGTAFGAGLLSSLAVQDLSPQYLKFETSAASEGDLTFWGLGYSSAQRQSVYQSQYNAFGGGPPTYSGWSQVDAQQNAAGNKIVVFTNSQLDIPGFGILYQTPVLLDSNGNLSSYSSTTGTFTSMQFPSNDVTDSFVIVGNQVYQWSATAGNWALVASATSPMGFAIVRVAAAPYQTGTSKGWFGPSALWALDQAGYIWTSTAPIQVR